MLKDDADKEGLDVDWIAVAAEEVATEEMDMLPRHGRYLLQQPDRLLVVGGLVPLRRDREQDAIVGDDDVADQPAALVGVIVPRSTCPAGDTKYDSYCAMSLVQ